MPLSDSESESTGDDETAAASSAYEDVFEMELEEPALSAGPGQRVSPVSEDGATARSLEDIGAFFRDHHSAGSLPENEDGFYVGSVRNARLKVNPAALRGADLQSKMVNQDGDFVSAPASCSTVSAPCSAKPSFALFGLNKSANRAPESQQLNSAQKGQSNLFASTEKDDLFSGDDFIFN